MTAENRDLRGGYGDGDTSARAVLLTMTAASAFLGDADLHVTVPLVSWALSNADAARELQAAAVSAYCHRLLRAPMPPHLTCVVHRAFAAGMTRALVVEMAPLPTPGCVALLTHLAGVALATGDQALQTILLIYFSKFKLIKRPECLAWALLQR
jgi:hypothetical protein